ncbi:hypothetical protein [Rhodococcoides kyotonense]|uniref:Uncharacterized protein n=1 Tax=Rhodococcoides kyotonense TaxID=398843 RepID=A0A239CPI6_9NOCA|nr:hypothetical protein [Rhodococcus kyotonensis]SNS22047.1 hypothetical protein SAMN05421642_101134 [Rhodococcus kyotonensis]
MATDSEKSLQEISDQAQDAPKTEVPAGALKAVRAFVGEHGGSASAVLQPIGRAGTRLTLVGADGVLGDQVVANDEVARALVAEVESLTESEWDRELISSVNPAPGHYRKMAGWVARQTRFPKARNAVLEK